jgi:TfoX/Sxy family transcriptional regulator of competence genes
VQEYDAQVTAYNAHQAKLSAYAQARSQAQWARGISDFATDTLSNMLGDLKAKPLLVAAGFVNDGVIGALAQKHVSILKAQSAALKAESAVAVERYLTVPGGSAAAKTLNLASWEKYLEADKWERSALRAGSKIEARLPIIGLAVTAVDVGYDIKTGKPVGKAIISGVGGALAAAGAGAMIGSLFPVPVVGTLAGAAAGLVVGLATSGALDAAYDSLSQGTRDAIEDGFDAVGHGLADAGDEVGDTAKKVWNSIF